MLFYYRARLYHILIINSGIIVVVDMALRSKLKKNVSSIVLVLPCADLSQQIRAVAMIYCAKPQLFDSSTRPFYVVFHKRVLPTH